MLYFENAREHFAAASSVSAEIGMLNRENSECRFYHRFADMIPDRVDVDTLVLAFKIALKDAQREGEDTSPFISLVPFYVRQCTSLEFAHEFRKKYIKEVLGLSYFELPDVDYGYTEVNPDVLDISNKDRNEVLAGLYNASTPIGMGFAQYNPMTWTKEIAAMYFEHCGDPDIDGRISFKYIMGRPVNCLFDGNLLYVRGYNNDNEWGLAQKVVATCHNIQPTRKK